MKTNIYKIAMVAAVGLWTAPASAQSLGVPLHFGLMEAATDEYGHLLDGTALAPGALVQILAAPEGIFPPAVDGTPDPRNPVLAEVRIGQGTDPAAGAIGKASGSVSINRQQGNRLFARVYNRPTAEESSFYADSTLYTNSTTAYGVFQIAGLQTTQPLDDGDDDGDGLINSWERSLGTDPYLADSDGDGMSDYHEMLAGTNPLDAEDVLRMVQAIPQANGTVVVTWHSVPGKTYQIQHTTLDLSAPEVEFEPVGVAITAEHDETVTVITNLPGVGMQHFRVVLVE
ncbi:MAG TPA: thrombospondin type 3 repeat-containing protein [Kiritimatiellia bacterium]|nr:thrombospondin type 3 repeat-containing protein [Kiritimatiellia bacterium]HMP00138.1 thrombospondin type 3 repeat-containing protein [Kiritimatiellia bacterium]HMP96660.1 thrombospondin type 3 repeat-containing protein [Kiritimatiellia bacterium]